MLVARDIPEAVELSEANPDETVYFPGGGVKFVESLTQVSWPRFEKAEVIDDGKTLAVLLREFDGTISAVRIPVDRVAD
jgi:hypothetical protein